MSNFILELSTGLKSFFREKINLVIVLLGLIVFLILYIYVEILDSNYHFYMNTKTSLEIVNNNFNKEKKEFDSYDGNVKKALSTEDKLIRKNNKKFHLYFLLKKIGF